MGKPKWKTMTPAEKIEETERLEELLKERKKEYAVVKEGKHWKDPDVLRAYRLVKCTRERLEQIEDPAKMEARNKANAEFNRKRRSDPVSGPKMARSRLANIHRERENQKKRASHRRATDPNYRQKIYASNAATNNFPFVCFICQKKINISYRAKHMRIHDREKTMLQPISDEEARQIERSTNPTVDWHAWATAHLYSITGSMSRGITNMKPTTDPSRMISLVKSTRSSPNGLKGIPPLDHGTLMEDVAVEWYMCIFPERKVRTCGIFTFPQLQLLKSTPDRSVNHDRVLEVKCPISSTLDEVKWLEKNNGKFQLKQATQYYDQIAFHLLCSGLQYCDLIVFISPVEYFVKEYHYSDMVPRMREIIKKSLAWYCEEITRTVPQTAPRPLKIPSPGRNRSYTVATEFDGTPGSLTQDETKVLELQLEVLMKLWNSYRERRICTDDPKWDIPQKFKIRKKLLEKLLGIVSMEEEDDNEAADSNDDEEEDDYYDEDPRDIVDEVSDMDYESGESDEDSSPVPVFNPAEEETTVNKSAAGSNGRSLPRRNPPRNQAHNRDSGDRDGYQRDNRRKPLVSGSSNQNTNEPLSQSTFIKEGIEEIILEDDEPEKETFPVTAEEIILKYPRPFSAPVLTLEMFEEIKKALQMPPTDNVVSGYSLNIHQQDLAILSKNTEWLIDLNIDFYLELIKERSQREEGYPSVYIFHSFFYPLLTGTNGFNAVKDTTEKDDIFQSDLLLIPVHLNAHWRLVVVKVQEKSIECYDSMGNTNTGVLNVIIDKNIEEVILQWEHLHKQQKEKDESHSQDGTSTEDVGEHGEDGDIDDGDKTLTVCDTKKEFNLEEAIANSPWTKLNTPSDTIPQQTNTIDCGVFVLQYAEYLSRKMDFDFNQSHIPYFRKRITYETLTKTLLA